MADQFRRLYGGDILPGSNVDPNNDLIAIRDASVSTDEKHKEITPNQFKVSINLDNVDNTSDLNKPVSSATQTALTGEASARASADNVLTTLVNTKVVTATTVSSMRALVSSTAATGATVQLQGYNIVNDGGGGTFRIRAAIGGETYDNGVRFLMNDGRVAERVVYDRISVKAFGARGVATDDTAAIQAAINYCETAKIGLDFPGGIFGITSVTVSSCDMTGTAAPERQTGKGTILYHLPGATNHMIRSRPVDYAAGRNKGRRRNFSMIGNRETNIKTSCTTTILAASSRTSFTVDSTWLSNFYPQAAPTDPPYYGQCFFYTSDGQYCGHAIVQSFSAGVVTLLTGSDCYATRTSGSATMEVGWQVSFTPYITETSGTYGTQSYYDPGMAGYAAISEEDAQYYASWENIKIECFHVGIRRTFQGAISTDQITCERTNIGLSSSSWAGDASIGFTSIAGDYSRDYVTFTSGDQSQLFTRKSTNSLTPTFNTDFRASIGLYSGATGGDIYSELTLDACSVAIYGKASEVKFGKLWIDRNRFNAISGWAFHFAIDQLEMRCESSTTNTKTACNFDSSTLRISLLRSTQWQNKKYLNLFSVTGGSIVHIFSIQNGRFSGDEGYTNLVGNSGFIEVGREFTGGFTRIPQSRLGPSLDSLGGANRVSSIPSYLLSKGYTTYNLSLDASAVTSSIAFGDGFQGSFHGGAIGGTPISPTAIPNQRSLINLVGYGFDGNSDFSNGYAVGGSMRMESTEAWSTSGHGSRWIANATKKTTQTQYDCFVAEPESALITPIGDSWSIGLKVFMNGVLKQAYATAPQNVTIGGNTYSLRQLYIEA